MQRRFHRSPARLNEMTDAASDVLLAAVEERYLLTLVFRSPIGWNQSSGYGYRVRRRVVRLEVSNLRASPLTSGQVRSLPSRLPSLRPGPDHAWHTEMFDVHRFGPTEGGRSSSSSSVVVVLAVLPIHPWEIDVQTLANPENHFDTVEYDGRERVRVTSAADGPGKWRVSDYDLDGRMVLSVICSLTRDRTISGGESRPPQPEEETEER